MRRIAFVHLLVFVAVIRFPGLAGAKAGAAWLMPLFATGSANEAQAALSLTVPDSPAKAYTVHQIGVLKAQAGSGGGGNPYSVKSKGGNVALCQKTLSGNNCSS
jgi:hypothetical protein